MPSTLSPRELQQLQRSAWPSHLHAIAAQHPRAVEGPVSAARAEDHSTLPLGHLALAIPPVLIVAGMGPAEVSIGLRFTTCLNCSAFAFCLALSQPGKKTRILSAIAVPPNRTSGPPSLGVS